MFFLFPLLPLSSAALLNPAYLTFEQAEWSILVGPDPAGYCALICWSWVVTTPALLCHRDTAQGTQSHLPGAFLAFRCVFMGQGLKVSFHAWKGSIMENYWKYLMKIIDHISWKSMKIFHENHWRYFMEINEYIWWKSLKIFHGNQWNI